MMSTEAWDAFTLFRLPQEVMKKVEKLSVMGVPCRTVVTVKDLHSKDQVSHRRLR